MWRGSYGILRVTALILRRFSAQEHDTDDSPHQCLIIGCFIHKIYFVCICTRHEVVGMESNVFSFTL